MWQPQMIIMVTHRMLATGNVAAAVVRVRLIHHFPLQYVFPGMIWIFSWANFVSSKNSFMKKITKIFDCQSYL